MHLFIYEEKVELDTLNYFSGFIINLCPKKSQ